MSVAVIFARLSATASPLIISIVVFSHQLPIAPVEPAFLESVKGIVVVGGFQHQAPLKVPGVVDEVSPHIIEAFFGYTLGRNQKLFGKQASVIVEGELHVCEKTLVRDGNLCRLPSSLVRPVSNQFAVGDAVIRLERLFFDETPTLIVLIDIASRVRLIGRNQT